MCRCAGVPVCRVEGHGVRAGGHAHVTSATWYVGTPLLNWRSAGAGVRRIGSAETENRGQVAEHGHGSGQCHGERGDVALIAHEG